ncbi:type I 3-dehydroquinate dehydratase [Methanoculleus sp. FWC-SCC1]|uniref:3-dehydroquinate dehydratase n=1 Tax=Methanoculleus frigidifontis TaxID=2584085 RepID=A0ABT8M681_9EURY|nr:type I 3-dehydroquinate dehydratase [Methanoculleus sp. FWC-SCC1]MDN7023439.1 type I 3-dehydroquinate dehydratase [Methanoculleus sp. FWC-SCC1]
MKIVASIQEPDMLDMAVSAKANFIELRLDMMEGDLAGTVELIRARTVLPLIATLRSRDEGGRFEGTSDDWFAIIEPLVRHVDLVDIETRYREHAPKIMSHGVQIIASLHRPDMPTRFELEQIALELRLFGDIPKIAVGLRSQAELLDLLAYTSEAPKPICVSIVGEQFRCARALLPLFGSELAYCHVGTPTARGQYHVEELKQLLEMLR